LTGFERARVRHDVQWCDSKNDSTSNQTRAKRGASCNANTAGDEGETMTWQSDKWPAYKTVGFLLLTGVGLWGVLGVAIRVLLH
jgi:hypothetical protein